MPKYLIDIGLYQRQYAENRKGEYTNQTAFNHLEIKEMKGLCAVECLAALSGIFNILLMSEFSTYFEAKENSQVDVDSFSINFRNLAELGAAITDNCIEKVSECLEGYEQLMKETDGNK